MKKYIISLDQGTTSCRSILFDQNKNIVHVEQQEFTQIMPENGWVEHDAVEILNTQLETLNLLIQNSNIDIKDVDSIGITNQRETTVLWDKKSGKPVYNAIVWQDNRTADFCKSIIKEGHEEIIRNKTGLVVDSYFSSTKIHWILNHSAECKDLIKKGDLLFGTIDTWLIWNLTGNHFTDVTNASRTQLLNIHELKWDKELLDIFQIPSSILPEVKQSADDFGYWNFKDHQIPIRGVAGDQQAALFGQECIEKGMAKNTYGTGCFMLMNTGENIISSKNGLLTTVAWSVDGKVNYALEGSVFIAGAAIQWLRDSLKIITHASETEQLSNATKDEDVLFIPAFSGLGAPYWNMNFKGAILGITRNTGIAEIAKAALESLAFQSKDVLIAMEKDANFKLKSLAVDGGACQNNYLMQFQADVLNCKVVKPAQIESTALGAAMLAGHKSVFFEKNTTQNSKNKTTFNPQKSTKIDEKIKAWNKAISSLVNYYDQE
ncbi:MAG: glycerol kinase GlpK [Bacteroidota bacterium]|nr:glycerol kinase GlpK [Bacteroidota bacterium]